MEHREQIVRMTEYATDSLFRIARAMPTDKLTWKPLDNGRTALDQLQECAQTSLLFLGILKPEKMLDRSPEAIAKRKEARSKWSLDETEKQAKANTKELCMAIKSFPVERLSESVKLPWGESASYEDVLGFQYWNVVYHQGQINYIQTLYGDFEMH